MAKKQKIKNEDPSINFRLSPELKKWITNKAISENKTVSNYLRDHLQSYMDGNLLENQMGSYYEILFVNTTRFLQLVAFVFAKRHNSECKSTIKQLNHHIRTIKEMEIEVVQPEVVEEFDKVLEDLIRVKNMDRTSNAPTFKFCESSNSNQNFNYSLLENYLLNFLKPYNRKKIL